MGFGISLLLATAGAILAFAVNATVSGVNIHTVGWILLVAGAIGLVITMFLWDGTNRSGRSTTYVRRDDDLPPPV